MRSGRIWPKQIDAVQHMHSEWRLMLPVAAFAFGCALFMATSFQSPSLLVLSIVAAITIIASFYNLIPFRSLGYCFVAFLIGYTVAAIRTQSLETTIVRSEHFTYLEGRVNEIELRAERTPRITIKPDMIERWSTPVPRKIRLLARKAIPEDLKAGDSVRLPAILKPPEGPIVPGGFDFARRAFFEGIGGEGYVAGDIQILNGTSPSPTLAERINHRRSEVGHALRAKVPGQAGAVGTALLTGKRDHIHDEVAQNFRDSGLAHLMAISGLHMGLVAAGAFFTLEFLFALFPAVALRIPPRKAAACGAWGFAAAYLLLSGAGIPTLRAFVMVSIGLLAVLLDRRVLSLRSVALAALAVLVMRPESILSVGFQMSFAATTALVAFFERFGGHPLFHMRGISLGMRLAKFILITLVTTLIAELAIAPFALYHFQALPLVGLGANLFAVPLMTFIVMPLLLLFLLLLPLGAEGIVTGMLDLSLQALIGIAGYFGDTISVVAYTSSAEPVFLAAASLLLFLIVILKGRAQLGACIIAIFALTLSYQPRVYPILIDNGGRVVAYSSVTTASDFLIAGGRRGGFRDENWARFWGMGPETRPETLKRLCDSDACIVMLTDTLSVAEAKSVGGLRHSCAYLTVTVGPRIWERLCKGNSIFVSRQLLDERGPLAIDPATKGLAWAREVGYRPWQLKSESRD